MAKNERLLALAAERADDLVDFAQRLIRTPSMSGEEEAVATILQEEMRRLGYDDVSVDRSGNVIGLIRGTGGGRSVMLNTHLDHVSPGDAGRWISPPFSATLRDGAVYGRGAVDIKGPMAAQVYAGALLTAAERRPPGDLFVVGAVMEERGGLGTRNLGRHLRVDCAVVGEPSSNTLRRGHRGRVALVAEVHGRAAHASVPERGVNPHYSLAAFLGRLRSLEMRRQEPFGPSTVAPTLYATDNTSPNVIPETARLLLDWRNVPDESPEMILALLRPLLAQSLEDEATGTVEIEHEHLTTYTGESDDFPSLFPSFVLSEDDPHVRAAGEALEQLLGRPFPPSVWPFATDGGHLMAAGIPTVGFGPGDEAQAHVVDEHIHVAELVEATAANAALVLALSTLHL